MKLGVYNAILHDRPLEDAIKVIADLGLNGIEINSGGFLPSVHIPEIDEIIAGRIAVEDSALRRSPHTLDQVASDDWDRPYSRRQAAFPEPSLVRDKYFPPVSRIDNAWGDRHLTCTCPAPEDVEAATGPLRSTASGSTAQPTAVLTAEEK